jgi:hypothetical protein
VVVVAVAVAVVVVAVAAVAAVIAVAMTIPTELPMEHAIRPQVLALALAPPKRLHLLLF